MKKTIIFLAFLLISFSFSSCEEAEEALGLTKDFTVRVTANIPVHIDQTSGDWVSHSNTAVISIDTDDTHDYLNKIRNIKINSLSYKIINFNGDPNGEVDASFYVENEVSLSNAMVVKPEADKGTVFKITETDELSRIANLLKNGKKVTVKYAGDALCDAADMNFTVEVKLDAKITVGL